MTAAERSGAALRVALPTGLPTPHLSDDELADYHRDRLGQEAAERVAAHLLDCEDCGERLLAFADFDAPENAEPLSQFEEAAAWRLVKPPAAAPAVQPSRTFPWRAAAASLLVTTLTAGFFALSSSRELARVAAPEVNTPVVDLFATERRSGSASEAPVALPGTAAGLVVVLNPERRESFDHYSVAVFGATGELLWRGEGLEKNSFGSFTVYLSRKLASASPLSLELLGEGPGSPESLGSYRLEINSP